MQFGGLIQLPYSCQRHCIEQNFNRLETNLITINPTKFKEINLWNYPKKKKNHGIMPTKMTWKNIT